MQEKLRGPHELLEGLYTQFSQTLEPVQVDFRRSLSWSKLGDSGTHQIHPYPAKLLPIIAEFFVATRKKSIGQDYVLDPFCGSGTVALEASLAGATPLVVDANPFALLLSKVKTTPYDTALLSEKLNDVLKSARRRVRAPELNIVNASLWYSPRLKRELEILAASIRHIDNEPIRDFFRISLSATARRLSFADPMISVPVRHRESERHSVKSNSAIRSRLQWLEIVAAADEFKRVSLENIARVEDANRKNPRRRAAKVVGTDAKELKLSCHGIEAVPFILTSPPYGSAQKYIRASGLALNWLELAAPGDLAQLENKSIGREHVSRSQSKVCLHTLPHEFSNLLDEVAEINPRRARITELYLEEMHDSLDEMSRVVSPGGQVAVVIGNNQVCGRLLRNDVFAESVMLRSGLKMKLSLRDTIKSRGLMTKRNKTASVISTESILVFEKE